MPHVKTTCLKCFANQKRLKIAVVSGQGPIEADFLFDFGDGSNWQQAEA